MIDRYYQERASINTRADAIANDFHKLSYYNRVWSRPEWLGFPLLKFPSDIIVQQMIVSKTRPSVIIETGTAQGGSALFFATVMDALGLGRIVSIDLEARANLPMHPRIEYIIGSSTSEAVVAQLDAIIRKTPGNVMMILDSSHTDAHVYSELKALSRFVTPGSFLIVEDTNIGGNPVYTDYAPEFGPGPRGALDQFLIENSDFEVTDLHNAFFLSHNIGGYLRRRGG